MAGGGIIDLLNKRLRDRLKEIEILNIFTDVCEVSAARFGMVQLIHPTPGRCCYALAQAASLASRSQGGHILTPLHNSTHSCPLFLD